MTSVCENLEDVPLANLHGALQYLRRFEQYQ